MSLFSSSPLAARILVATIVAIIPLAYLLIVLHLLRLLVVPPLLLLFAAAECLFSLYHAYLVRQCQTKLHPHQHDEAFLRSVMLRALGTGMAPVFPPPPTAVSPTSLRLRDPITPSRPVSPSGFAPTGTPLPFSDPRAVEFRQHQALWFGGCDWSDIYEENLREWLAWVLFGVDLHDPILHECPSKLAFMQQCLGWIQNRAGSQLPPGYNAKLRTSTIRLTLDRVKVVSRPLVLYAATALATAVTKCLMLRHRFKIHTYAGIDCLVRVPKDWKPENATKDALLRPLVFVHGLGIGLTQYATTLHYFAKAPLAKCRPVLFPLQPSISTEFFHPSHLVHPSQQTMTQALVEAVTNLGWSECGFDLVGHSNGSIVAGWIVKSAPELVKRLCLIDPVCFCLWEPYVAYNFLYSKPKTGIEILMRYFIGCELGVALSLQRHFNWAANILFPADVPGFSDPSRTTIFLAGKDSILNAPRIRSYLLENGMKDADSVVVVNAATGETKTREGDGKGSGGLVVAWEGEHGESLITGSEQFERVVRWLEGKGLERG